MSRILKQPCDTRVTTTDEEVALISRLTYAHVILNVTYFFEPFLFVEPIGDVL